MPLDDETRLLEIGDIVHIPPDRVERRVSKIEGGLIWCGRGSKRGVHLGPFYRHELLKAKR